MTNWAEWQGLEREISIKARVQSGEIPRICRDGDETHDRLLQSNVKQIAYDYTARVGRLFQESGSCCDMQGCIDLFTKLDPEVTQIQTWSGEFTDTVYTRVGGDWHACCARIYAPLEADGSRQTLLRDIEVWSRATDHVLAADEGEEGEP